MIDTIKILKQIDRTIGPIVLKILPKKLKTTKKPVVPKKILFIRPGGMGDAILMLPALKAVRKKYPNIKIDILCEKRNQGVFEAVPFINDIFSYKIFFNLILILNKKYDIVIDTEQYHILTSAIMRLIKSKFKSGFCINGREKMHTSSIPYDHNMYEAESFWCLTRSLLEINKSLSWDFPYFEQTETSYSRELSIQNYVCFFPGATIEERLWPDERWAKVMDWLLSYGWHCVLLGGKKEINQCKRIITHCKTNGIIDLSGKLNISETATILTNAALLVSTDSGILHLGVLCDLATISLFGAGIAPKWAPAGEKHIIINKKLECSPCTKFGTTPPCPNNKKCIMEIRSMDVIKTISKAINTSTYLAHDLH